MPTPHFPGGVLHVLLVADVADQPLGTDRMLIFDGTGPFTIHGFAAQPGGTIISVINAANPIAFRLFHESGGCPTPADRIIGIGPFSDFLVGSGMLLIYDVTVLRWREMTRFS